VAGLSLAGCSGAALSSAPRSLATAGAPSYSVGGTPAVRSFAATEPAGPLRYVALGDSYTIGTSVKPRERWPNQLVRMLNPGADLDLVANLAVNGSTAEDVLDDQLGQLAGLEPDLVSLLIGVNDVVRNAEVEAYRTNLRSILSDLAGRLPPDRILLVTTPDYTLTPQGGEFGDPGRQSTRIHAFNDVLVSEAASMAMLVVDISPVADLVPDDPSLVAEDGLHPSAKQYSAWVELIAPRLRKLLHATTTRP
jgi:lysophospholipase L1-like esterase